MITINVSNVDSQTLGLVCYDNTASNWWTPIASPTVEGWCRENGIAFDYSIGSNADGIDHVIFKFKNKEDATAFKLRWF